MRLDKLTILVTGGGSGIGLALAGRLLARGNTVLICGRSEARLDAAKRLLSGLHTFSCDITSRSDRERLAAHVEASFPDLDILVNNAGTMERLDLTTGEADPGAFERELNVNFLAPVELTHLLLPLLQQRKSAIINVSSGLAYVPMARAPLYSASKAALHSYTQSLREQLKGSAVEVVEILPPTVDTAMSKDLATRKIDPDTFAEQAIDALERGRREIRLGQTRALYTLARVAPGFIHDRVNHDRVHGTA